MAHQISAADLNALYTGYKATYEESFNSYEPKLSDVLADIETSEMEREAYPISAIASIMTRWDGDRVYNDLLTKVTYVDNGQPFQHAFRIKRRDLELRRKIQIEQAAKGSGIAAKALEDDLLKTALQGGSAAAYVDGVNFFANNHPIVPWDASVGTWSNLRTGFALTKANAQTALADMWARKGWNNREMNLMQFEVIVPSGLGWTAKQIFEQVMSSDAGVATAGGNTNILAGQAKVRIVPQLNDEPTVWYVVATDGPKPFVLQEWRPLEIVRRFDLTSENVFSRDEFEIGSSRGVEFGRILPHTIMRCEG